MDARVNVTWERQNGDLPDPVNYDATDEEIRRWAAEAVRSGTVPGIPADEDVDFTGYMVDKYDVGEGRPVPQIFIRPKTGFGH